MVEETVQVKYLYTAIVLATIALCGILLYANTEQHDFGYSTYYVLRLYGQQLSLEAWRSGLWTFRYNSTPLFHLEPSNDLEPIPLD